MKVLITGGAGFIGSNLVEEFLKRGDEVTVIDNLKTGDIRNIKPFLDKINFVNDSINNLVVMKKICENIDYIFHLAAIPSVPFSLSAPSETNEANITGTLNVLIAAKEAGVKRVIYAASSSRYGDSDAKIKTEDLPTNPLSFYALQKLTSENYCKLFYELYGLETVRIVFFNVFGPKQNPDSEYSAVIPKFIKLILKNEKPIIYGDGTTSRDFTYVDNVINAMILSCTAENAAGEVFNAACGDSITLLELVTRINRLLGKNLSPQFENFRKGDIKHSLAGIKKAEFILGYKPSVGFDEGLIKTIEDIKND
jgi:nucleoside-diphosphate-sugar epimerase